MGNSKGAKALIVGELEKAKALSALGHSCRAIGKELGRSDKTIKKALTRSPEVIQEVKDIKAELAERYQAEARRILDSINDKDIEKASLQNKAVSSGILLDKALLLKGEATSINVSVLLDAVQAAKEYQAARSDEAMRAVRQRMSRVQG
jgi:IS30 family transposase